MKKNFKDHCIDTCLNLFQSKKKKKITFSSSIFELTHEARIHTCHPSTSKFSFLRSLLINPLLSLLEEGPTSLKSRTISDETYTAPWRDDEGMLKTFSNLLVISSSFIQRKFQTDYPPCFPPRHVLAQLWKNVLSLKLRR